MRRKIGGKEEEKKRKRGGKEDRQSGIVLDYCKLFTGLSLLIVPSSEVTFPLSPNLGELTDNFLLDV